jgi:tetratricopeptide (TPR) repeat protein
LSKDDIESELLSALPDDDDDFGMAAPPPPPPPPPAAAFVPPVAPDVVEENLFADEDDFFDLAAELESELSDEDEQISLSEEEQSLEEIFKEFKKGVEQQLDSEDYDTHYNLGIAYKEMGLIDEAIGEFQLASKDPKRAVECASMLGLCFLEKGMPQLAIKWYRKGLEIAEITEEEHVGLLYDLGSAYVEVGDTDNAQKAFMEVYGMNTNYREIVTRIKQLEDARK